MVGYGNMFYGLGLGFGGGYSNQFLTFTVPVYLLVFSVLFIVLAKLLNSALAALPVAVLVTAATAAYALVVLRAMPIFFGFNIAAIVGYLLVAAVIYKMWYRV